MKTPIYDYVKNYASASALRLHMPGHKGVGALGAEALDITEIKGADSLYEASGIIAESEKSASRLFGCDTFFGTEGSSQCIRAMLMLCELWAKRQGRKPKIAAACNVHRAFLTAVSLLDSRVVWLGTKREESYLSCTVTPELLEETLVREDITAVYVTSPDYLGAVADVEALAQVCHRHNTLLLVDNAHGAYLRFLPNSRHPMDLGADLCCDSAHKTLPVLTGGAYLHIKDGELAKDARRAMALFGSTSPSYLILQSLDLANAYLEDYPKILKAFLSPLKELKEKLSLHGYKLFGDEELKITLCPKDFGYTGEELSYILEENNVFCEFADKDYLVLMFTPEIGTEGLGEIQEILLSLEAKEPILTQPPAGVCCEQVLTPREAMLSLSECVAVENAVGRILASPCVSCPPAVPVVLCGQRISEEAVSAFRYYGVSECDVVVQKLS